MSGCTLSPLLSLCLFLVTLTTLVPGLQLFIYPLRPQIYSAITPEDVISSRSTPQLLVVASKSKRRIWEGGGRAEVGAEDVTVHVLP